MICSTNSKTEKLLDIHGYDTMLPLPGSAQCNGLILVIISKE